MLERSCFRNATHVNALLALDIDGTLIDTTPSFTRIVKELSGATDADVWRFRDVGGFNDDWELTRACTAWIRAGRPDIFGRIANVHDVLALCGNDPGDLAERCTVLYRGGYWRHERILVEGKLLTAAQTRVRVAACTGRDRWEFAKAEELLGYVFSEATTMEDAKKPDPHALERLMRDSDTMVFMVGDTAADRLCAERTQAATGRPVHFFEAGPHRPARDFITQLVAGVELELLAAACTAVPR